MAQDGYEDEAQERFKELCADLNLDVTTKENTWKTFNNVRHKYTLEGQQAHWLCCAIYVACRQASIPSVNSPTLHGSYVNLTRLLRTSGLSLVEFFDKSRKWGDMTNLNQEYRSKIERLERNFAVTTVIFKKFEPIFAGIFKDFSREIDESRANKKKLTPKSSSDIFEFCWTLFLCVKSSLRISDDLVNSYHLLLACTDLVFLNVVQSGRKSLLTPNFATLADTMNIDIRGEPPCIIHTLCDLYDGISVEAKTIKEFWLKPKIRTMIDSGILKGDSELITGLIEEAVFEQNSKKLEKEYEEYVLTEGDFDERMYLSSDRQFNFGVETENMSDTLVTLSPSLKAYPPLQELRHLVPSTPLTLGKKYPDKDAISPVTRATQTVSQLQALLSGRNTTPSAHLDEIFKNCIRNPKEEIADRLKRLRNRFCDAYTIKINNQPGLHLEFAHYRSELGATLYYRLLESILQGEVKIRGEKVEMTDILEENTFQTSLFALSLEIVLFSYNSQKKFPWILDTFELSGYHFHKVIEIVIRYEENLCRDVVKHLKQVEESVLESFAWTSESPLWTSLNILAEKNETIPSCEEVLLPSQIEKLGEHHPGSGENAPKRYAVIKTPSGEKCVPVAVGGNTQSTLIIQDKTSSQILGVVLPSKHGDKPKRGNSVALFFRKFYHLAFVRLQELCKNLKVETELLRKIWTCFQQAIVNHVEDLMKNRHLDQILMCCIFVLVKVVQHPTTFQEIMRCYRFQPQSSSAVYRDVLIADDSRGDIIKFYNGLFIDKMAKYATKFSTRLQEESIVPLSPIPTLRATPLSPIRKITDRHSVFLRPLKSDSTHSPSKPLRYNFNRSPTNSLRAINAMIQFADSKPKAVKRILGEDGISTGDSQISPKIFKRLQDFVDEKVIE